MLGVAVHKVGISDAGRLESTTASRRCVDVSDEARLETNPAAQRYEFYLGQRRIGLADYRDQGDAVSIPHTEIDPAVGGRGLGSQMVRGVLDDLRAQHRQVLPDCPFVAKVIRENGSYLDLVPVGSRAAYGLPAA